jgi:hypothetical protein
MNTLFLGAVMGWYLVIMGLFVLFRHSFLNTLVKDMLVQPALFFVVAVFTLIIGLLLVLSHNVWVLGWPVIVTIFSWMVLLSGLFRLFFFDKARASAEHFLQHPVWMKTSSAVFFAVGIYLLLNVYAVLA